MIFLNQVIFHHQNNSQTQAISLKQKFLHLLKISLIQKIFLDLFNLLDLLTSLNLAISQVPIYSRHHFISVNPLFSQKQKNLNHRLYSQDQTILTNLKYLLIQAVSQNQNSFQVQ